MDEWFAFVEHAPIGRRNLRLIQELTTRSTVVQDVRVSTKIEVTECRMEWPRLVAAAHLVGFEHIRIEMQLEWLDLRPVVANLRLVCASGESDGVTDAFVRSLRLPSLRRAVLNRMTLDIADITRVIATVSKDAREGLSRQMAFGAVAGLVEGERSAKTDAGSYKWHDERLRAVAVEALRYQAAETDAGTTGSVRDHIAAWLHDNVNDTPMNPTTARDVIIGWNPQESW